MKKKTKADSTNSSKEQSILKLNGPPSKSVVNTKPSLSTDNSVEYIGNSPAADTLQPNSSDKRDDEGTPVVENVVNITNRRKRANLMRRLSKKLERLRRVASHQFAPQKRLKRRAQKAARSFVRSRYAGSRGQNYKNLSTSGKIAVDNMIKNKAPLIARLATRLIPATRKAENLRMQGKRRNKAPTKIGKAGGLGIMPSPKLDRADYQETRMDIITEREKGISPSLKVKHPSHASATKLHAIKNTMDKEKARKEKLANRTKKPAAKKSTRLSPKKSKPKPKQNDTNSTSNINIRIGSGSRNVNLKLHNGSQRRPNKSGGTASTGSKTGGASKLKNKSSLGEESNPAFAAVMKLFPKIKAGGTGPINTHPTSIDGEPHPLGKKHRHRRKGMHSKNIGHLTEYSSLDPTSVVISELTPMKGGGTALRRGKTRKDLVPSNERKKEMNREEITESLFNRIKAKLGMSKKPLSPENAAKEKTLHTRLAKVNSDAKSKTPEKVDYTPAPKPAEKKPIKAKMPDNWEAKEKDHVARIKARESTKPKL